MFYYERIDSNKTNASKECNISHYWYFLNKGLKLKIEYYKIKKCEKI